MQDEQLSSGYEHNCLLVCHFFINLFLQQIPYYTLSKLLDCQLLFYQFDSKCCYKLLFSPLSILEYTWCIIYYQLFYNFLAFWLKKDCLFLLLYLCCLINLLPPSNLYRKYVFLLLYFYFKLLNRVCSIHYYFFSLIVILFLIYQILLSIFKTIL